ncbi:endonuclease 4 [bacterium HR17]|jgi:sugar phosphate isomerase/epimerase|uniref:Endonuclease 4 n=1 Tax=Candidatus Fervidibacter japonicus TaxID=2035412 RepID=A0A2H5XBS5_9BACT|nr:endonuclease 4 [bacterium HR17]
MEIGVAIARIERETLDDDLRAWSDAGVVAVECDYAPLVENPVRVLEMWRQAFRDARVRFWSVHAPFGGPHNLAHSDQRARRRAVEYFKFVLERIALVGAAVCVLHPSSTARPEVSPQKAWDWLRESLEELLPVAEELGLILAVENMLPEAAIGSDPAELSRFLAGFLTPHLRLCFDTGHAHIAGNVHLWLESVLPTVATFHLADNDKTRDLHLPPGYGTIPWDLLQPLLQAVDFPLIVEAYRWGNSSWQQFHDEVMATLTGRVVTLTVNGTTVTARCQRCGCILRRLPDGGTACGCI